MSVTARENEPPKISMLLRLRVWLKPPSSYIQAKLSTWHAEQGATRFGSPSMVGQLRHSTRHALRSRRSAIALRRWVSTLGIYIDAERADLEGPAYNIGSSAWDLVAICYYLQRDLFEPAKQGVAPGGILLAIVHITECGEQPTPTRARPGELRTYFDGWEILHYYEGKPNDSAHQRSVAEIVARRPRQSPNR